MANRKVTDLATLNEAPASGDTLHIVDVSDTAQDPAGSSKKITVANLVSALITAALSGYYTEAEINTLLSGYVQEGDLPTFADDETPSGTANGSNTMFALAHAPSPAASLLLFRNRTLMVRGTDYTLTGANIVFSTPPPAGAIIRAWYRYST